MNTFGNIINVVEYLDDYSKFLAAHVSTEWRLAVKCNTKDQVFTSTKRFVTATVNDTIIHDEYDEVFVQDPLDMVVEIIHLSYGRTSVTYLPKKRIILWIACSKENALLPIKSLLLSGSVPIQKKYYDSTYYYCTRRKCIHYYRKVNSIVLFFDRVTKIDSRTTTY